MNIFKWNHIINNKFKIITNKQIKSNIKIMKRQFYDSWEDTYMDIKDFKTINQNGNQFVNIISNSYYKIVIKNTWTNAIPDSYIHEIFSLFDYCEVQIKL